MAPRTSMMLRRQTMISLKCLASRYAKHGAFDSTKCQHYRLVKACTTGRCPHSTGKGYQGIGSFHSEDVDVLMAQSDDEYEIPGLPFDEQYPQQRYNPGDDFLLDRKTWTFLNHGAFGAALRVGHERAEQWRLRLELQPLRYFDRDLLPHLVYSARRLADFCNAPRESVTLIQNVTSGFNTVLKGYANELKEKAHVVLWDTSYGSLKKTANRYCDNVTEIPVSKYFDDFHNMEDPSSIFEVALSDSLLGDNKNLENALLILDHTTSNTAINMPLEKLSRIGKEHGMLIMVDGAHSLLAQKVALNQLPDVDFYLANGHKWLCCGRGVGLLYCPRSELRDTILMHPAVMSHGIDKGLQSRFLWDGCRDYASALSVPAVLDHWEQVGVQATQQKLRGTLENAVGLLRDMWNHPLNQSTLAPLSVHAPMMALVRLPNFLQKPNASSADAKSIQDYLYSQFIEVPIKCINGALYVRISSHVYNEISEYERLGETLLEYDGLN